MTTIRYEALVDFGIHLLTARGFESADARYIAEIAATTEAAGIHTHGAVLLGSIDGRLGETIRADARPKVLVERAATALVDGNGVVGSVCAKLAVAMARDKARASGCAVIAVRNTTWLGGLGAYILPLAREGLFAQLLAQNSHCRDSVPVGGLDARFSTNPIALAFPTHADPVIADFSTAVMSMGKVNTLARAGQRAAQPVFFTPEGALTDDPQAMRNGGAMFTAGGELDGHKGYALTLWIEALTAMAGGHCNNPETEPHQSFTLQVIDPTAFGDTAWYTAEMQRLVADVKSSRLRPGFEAIRLPGERMLRAIATSRKEGIVMDDALVERLNQLAAAAGVEPLAPYGCYSPAPSLDR